MKKIKKSQKLRRENDQGAGLEVEEGQEALKSLEKALLLVQEDPDLEKNLHGADQKTGVIDVMDLDQEIVEENQKSAEAENHATRREGKDRVLHHLALHP